MSNVIENVMMLPGNASLDLLSIFLEGEFATVPPTASSKSWGGMREGESASTGKQKGKKKEEELVPSEVRSGPATQPNRPVKRNSSMFFCTLSLLSLSLLSSLPEGRHRRLA